MDWNKVLVYLLSGLICVFSVFVTFKKRSYDQQLLNLRNQLVQKDNSVEIQKGLFVKKSLEVENLKSLVDRTSEDNKKLLNELDKNKEKVVQLTEVGIKLKKDYEAKFNAKQTVVVEKGVKRDKVEFEKEFNVYKVSGHTLTNPGEAIIKFSQTKPLTLTLVLTQDKEQNWKVYTSGNDDFNVDIKLAGVNPFIFEKKWYEKFGVVLNVGGGTFDKSAGALLGFGLSYDFYKFTLGPNVWFLTTGRNDRMYRDQLYLASVFKVKFGKKLYSF